MRRAAESAALACVTVAAAFLGQLAEGLSVEAEALSGEAATRPVERRPLPAEATPGSDDVWLPSRVIPTEELVQGGIYRLTDMGRSPSGSLCLADAGNQTVLIVSGDLELIRKVGRAGQGPGEFSDVHLQCALADSGDLFVYDHGYDRLTHFDPEGRVVDSVRAEAPPRSRLTPDGKFIYNEEDAFVWYDPGTDARERIPLEPGCARADTGYGTANGWLSVSDDWSWGVLVNHPTCADGESYEAIVINNAERWVTSHSFPLVRPLREQTIAVTNAVVVGHMAFVIHGSAFDVEEVSAVRVDVLGRDGELAWRTAIPRVIAFESVALTPTSLMLNDKRDDRLLVFETAQDPNRPGTDP